MITNLLRAVQSWWNNAILGGSSDGTVKYIYIPSPPAMFPVAAIVPIRLDEELADAGLETCGDLWPRSRTA